MRISVDADEGSNAAAVHVSEHDGIATVSFTPHPHGGPEVCWFRFVVRSSGGPIGRLRLALEHLDNALGGGSPGSIRPVVRPFGAGDDGWSRLRQAVVAERADGVRRAEWEHDAATTALEVALCYPYGAAHVDALVADSRGYWRADAIGVSSEGRPLIRLANRYADATAPGIYLLARQHAGETPGSWVLDGFLRHCADVRATTLVWCVPLADIDGVTRGDYGKDAPPMDLNRAWGAPPLRHEVLALQRDIARWTKRCAPRLAIDLHAPGMCEDDGLYAYGRKPETIASGEAARQERWAERLAQALGALASPRFLRFVRYAIRWTTPSSIDHFAAVTGVMPFIIEASYVAAPDGALTIERYRDAGRALARAALELARAEPG